MKKAYMVKTYGDWDGKFEDKYIFEDEQAARDFFLEEVADQKEMYLENYTEGPDDFFFEDGEKYYGDSRLVIDEGANCCEIFIDGEWCDHHCVVLFETLEIIPKK